MRPSKPPKEKRWFSKSRPFADLDARVAAYANERQQTKETLKKLGARLLKPHPFTGDWRCSVRQAGERNRLQAPTSGELITAVKEWVKKNLPAPAKEAA